MFIYADESGHSGRHIFREPQYYYQGAILSTEDCEPKLEPVMKGLCQDFGVDRLHANDMRLQDVAKAGSLILDVLDELPWLLHLTVIHKPYIAITKFVDTIFDSSENVLVPPLWYYHDFFRHTICCLFDDIITDSEKRRFWEAFLIDDYETLQNIAKVSRDSLTKIKIHKRLLQVAQDSLEFAIRHPKEFTLAANKTKKSYRGHTPNMVAFSSLIIAVHDFCRMYSVKPTAFYHDQQSEFGGSMREMHQLYGGVRPQEPENGMIARLEYTDYDLGKFSLPSSKELASLQAIDILIWISKKWEMIELVDINYRLTEHLDIYHISRRTSEKIVHTWGYKISNLDLDEDDERFGKGMIARMENQRRERYAEFLQRQNEQTQDIV